MSIFNAKNVAHWQPITLLLMILTTAPIGKIKVLLQYVYSRSEWSRLVLATQMGSHFIRLRPQQRSLQQVTPTKDELGSLERTITERQEANCLYKRQDWQIMEHTIAKQKTKLREWFLTLHSMLQRGQSHQPFLK